MPSGFEVDSGLFTEDYTGSIADLTFTPGEYGTQAVITVTLDHPVTRNDGTLKNDATIYLSTGEGWSTTDGTDLVHSDPAKKITQRGKWGAWATRAAELGADAPILAAGGGVYSSKGWAGLRFHFETEGAGEKYSFTDKATGEKKSGEKKGVVMPVEFLGTVDAPVTGQVGATAPAAFSIASLPDDIIEAWGPLAESTVDNAAFVKVVLASGLLTDDKLGAEVKGLATKALGDGSLREALSPLV